MPGLESPVYGLVGGGSRPPPHLPHIFCRPLPRPPRILMDLSAAPAASTNSHGKSIFSWKIDFHEKIGHEKIDFHEKIGEAAGAADKKYGGVGGAGAPPTSP